MSWSSELSGWLAADARPAPSSVGQWPVPELGRAAARDAQRPAEPDAAESAWQHGYDEGVAVGRAEAEGGVLGALVALGGATQSLRAVQASLAAEMEESLYALALAVAQRIVQRELQQDPALLRELVRRAVDVLPLDQSLEIHLHPDDLAALDASLEIQAAGGRRLDVQWVADPTMEPGGYQIETPQRVLDGRLDQAIVTMYQRLRDAN